MGQRKNEPTVVLVVEHEIGLAMLAADILEDAGYRTVEAYTADQALKVLDIRSDVHAVFTDVDLPGTLDGLSLAWLVKRRWPRVGVVVTSGKPGPRPGGLPDGALFIPKPNIASDLVRAVEAVLHSADRAEPMGIPERDAEHVSAPFLPEGIKIDQPHTGSGHAGGLAQPTPEPDE